MTKLSSISECVDVLEEPSEADTSVIQEGLLAFSTALYGAPSLIPIGAFAYDNEGSVAGGLVGHFAWGWLYVDKFWLPETLRGTGIGGHLLTMAEQRAKERDCRWAHLETTDYQALPFYERHGYEVFGVLEGYPPGAKQYYLRKALDAVLESRSSVARDSAAMTTQHRLEVVERPGRSEMKIVQDGLLAFNVKYVGHPAPLSFLACVRDADGEVAGGLVGRLAWRWLSVDMLWIPEHLRGHGVGSAVLRAAEKHAALRGYGWSRLESGIPSRSFYESHGYTIFGALDDYPPRGRQHYMRKAFGSN